MRHVIGFCIIFLAFCGPARADDLMALYTHLHQNPELSFQEEKTAARMAQELRALGFEVTENVGGYGVFGVLKNGAGPTLMIRADMDALPVKEQTGLPFSSAATAEITPGEVVSVMHACGHDVHMTVWVGTARQLVQRKAEWSGTLVFIAQPAEERGAGARAMLEDGLFKRVPLPDYNLALHVNAALPAGQVTYVSGFALANVDSVDITVYGVGGHGAYPHTTKDPIVLASKIVLALQTLVSREVDPQAPAVVTVGAFQGGSKHNVIPQEVKLQLTVRSYSDAVRAQLLEGIARIARGEAIAAGLPEDMLPKVDLKDEYTPAVYNTPALMNRAAQAMRNVLGAENVSEAKPVMGGEDFGQYGRTPEKIPSAIFWLGAVAPEAYEKARNGGQALPSLHSPFFAPDAKPTIDTGVKSMTAIALDLLQKP